MISLLNNPLPGSSHGQSKYLLTTVRTNLSRGSEENVERREQRVANEFQAAESVGWSGRKRHDFLHITAALRADFMTCFALYCSRPSRSALVSFRNKSRTDLKVSSMALRAIPCLCCTPQLCGGFKLTRHIVCSSPGDYFLCV